ncbi:hypothetical protein DVH24_014452 [Malus domestica]|uniref:RRM domain-containing protein n=1 Tax=Malus domestica TaxID=3750 RepID=A0A498KK97_MALDO|nr:hypothetical protein DVH24_014452 [Malus domestica]
METCEEAREKGRDENIVVGASYLFRVWVAQRPPGYAFVDFDDSRDAEDAILELDEVCTASSLEIFPSALLLETRSQIHRPSRCYRNWKEQQIENLVWELWEGILERKIDNGLAVASRGNGPQFLITELKFVLNQQKSKEREMATSSSILKVGLVIAEMCIGGYIVGPLLYWHFMEGLVAVSHFSSSSFSTCLPCTGNCSSHHDLHPHW